MADVIRKATNRFTKGLVMDFSPENTKNEVLTNALNATLLTFNGNELSLLNDMGNGRVETAYLPEGYMPVGTCEYGGIIYIVSYNPLEDKSLIGCFPSPERNISMDELGMPKVSINRTDFLNIKEDGNPDDSGLILNNTRYVTLKNDNLNPGDKFIISSNKDIYNESLADLWVDKDHKHYAGMIDPDKFELVKNPIIALNVVSLEDSGKIVYLNSTIRSYEVPNSYTIDDKQYTDKYKYHILGTMSENNGTWNQKVDIDEYRNTLSSGYSVFKSKTSGKLAILAELIMVDSYSITHSVRPRVEHGLTIDNLFDVMIHTEVTPTLDKNNYSIAPKLRFYYLEDSLGYMLTRDGIRTLFTNTIDKETKVPTSLINNSFCNNIRLSDIYTETYDSDLNLTPTLKDVSKFNFPKAYTYHGRLNNYTGDLQDTTAMSSVYTKFTEGKYHRIDLSLVKPHSEYYNNVVQAKFYFYDPSGKSFTKYESSYINTSYTYFRSKFDPIYHDAQRDEANKNKTLYKMVSSPLLANSSIIENVEIEKFLEREVITYPEATNKDIEEGKLLYRKINESTYESLTGEPIEGETYYIEVKEKTFVSIGMQPSSNVLGKIYYYPDEKSYVKATQSDINKYYDFEKYPPTSTPPYGSPLVLYWQESNYSYEEITLYEATQMKNLGLDIYYNTQYIEVEFIQDFKDTSVQLFIVVPIDTFVNNNYFKPDAKLNYINGYDKPEGTYPLDDKIFLYTVSDFIPENMDSEYELEKEDCYKYHPLKLASIKMPDLVVQNGLDIPFKYSYTLVPCMNYGKLLHLAVSNTIDFSKLHAFNLSGFHTWKYYVEGNNLRLTFGTDVYDTFEEFKVDGIILEFYDCRGFAGSIELLDKKSYSGTFTKVISLNSLHSLGRRRVFDDSYATKEYKRNINYDIGEPNPETGWSSLKEIQADSSEEFGNEHNDCGTIYSNLVYGVKTYFRRTIVKDEVNPDNSTYEFIRKEDFYVYTLPIYNDFYHTHLNFNTLINPELNFTLTYKLKDNSIKDVYNSSVITNGYNTADNTNVTSYLRGFYNQKLLDLIRYYVYKGLTDVYLECGLVKEYENLNLSYLPALSNNFRCNLQLMSDNDPNVPFTINSSLEGLVGTNQILNYNNLIDENVNKFAFYNGSTTYNESLAGSGFLETEGSKPIRINYEFVVGYTASILDIRSTQVLATTVCALLHKTSSGEYNYEDFGVYLSEDKFLSNMMFYNEGTAEKEIFGLCRQVDVGLNLNMADLCFIITSVESEAHQIKSAKKLNSGDPLRLLVGNIGKLTFCQPHAHGLSELNGVNIHELGAGVYGIPPEVGVWDAGDSDEDTMGTAPRNFLFKSPRYNLSLNSKKAINYHGEFLSTVEWNTIDTGKVWGVDIDDGDAGEENGAWNGPYSMRTYEGFTSNEIAIFNKKMLETMKSVYAYNPDYDSLSVNVGNVELLKYNPSFTSNLINTDSYLEGITNLNDYILLGPINYSEYLLKLSNRSVQGTSVGVKIFESGTTPIELLLFVPNFDLCGTPKNPCLISTLTYNTPVPREMEYDLEFSSSNITVIKHSNGDNTFMSGLPNKKVLYAYHKDHDKMILLDVSNYTINDSGVLSLKNIVTSTKEDCSIEFTPEMNKGIFSGGTSFNYTLELKKGEKTETIDLNLSMILDKYRVSPIKVGSGSFFLGLEYTHRDSRTGYDFILKPYMHINNVSVKDDSSYSVKIKSITMKVNAVSLNNTVSLGGGSIDLTKQSEETLHKLVTTTSDLEISLMTNYNTYVPKFMSDLVVDFAGLGYHETIKANGSVIDSSSHSISVNSNGEIIINYLANANYNNNPYILGLLEFEITKVEFAITLGNKLEILPESFISTTKTSYYSKIDSNDDKYKILDDYQSARLRGTSLTLNDLEYSPNPDGHRLFIKDNICVYNSSYRGKLYYRSLDYQNDRHTWGARKDTSLKYLNCIYLLTGPCFTTDNLGT